MRPFGSSHWISPNADDDATQEYANRAIQAATSCTDVLFNAEGSSTPTQADSTAYQGYFISAGLVRANLLSGCGIHGDGARISGDLVTGEVSRAPQVPG